MKILFFIWLFLLLFSASAVAYYQYKSAQHHLPGKGHVFLSLSWLVRSSCFDEEGNVYRKKGLIWTIVGNVLLIAGGYYFWWS